MTNPGSPAAAAEKQERLTELLAKLGTIRDYARLLEDRHRLYIERVHPRFRESARNLLHYLALRHQLTKTGLPSRAEVTDAAMAVRAECVMLNKGPHIRRSMRALDDILRRMEAHQMKKTSKLRSLRVSNAVSPVEEASEPSGLP